jgi:hypothetical protein
MVPGITLFGPAGPVAKAEAFRQPGLAEVRTRLELQRRELISELVASALTLAHRTLIPVDFASLIDALVRRFEHYGYRMYASMYTLSRAGATPGPDDEFGSSDARRGRVRAGVPT